MSSVAPSDFVYANPGQERPFFWIRPVDEKGFEVDKLFEEAAYQNTRDLRLYRAQELLDEAVRAELVEKAVYAASRARKSEAVRDAKSYIFATFARLVDERITKERGLEHRPSSELEQFEVAGARSKTTISTDIEEAILRRQVLEAMSPEDRWIWERRLLGYEVQEIAAELNVSADCLSTRIRRGIDGVAKTLRLGRARQ
jgi:DNA-directed RNA polymerase specialized sigma24 family protein